MRPELFGAAVAAVTAVVHAASAAVVDVAYQSSAPAADQIVHVVPFV